jgi:hypothetical protein
MITTFQVTTSIISLVIIAIITALKSFGLPTKWAPFVGIALGIGSVLLVAFFEPTAEIIFTGIVIGLSALGLYDTGAKATLLIKNAVAKKK